MFEKVKNGCINLFQNKKFVTSACIGIGVALTTVAAVYAYRKGYDDGINDFCDELGYNCSDSSDETPIPAFDDPEELEALDD